MKFKSFKFVKICWWLKFNFLVEKFSNKIFYLEADPGGPKHKDPMDPDADPDPKQCWE
jgi:hypothetical protein